MPAPSPWSSSPACSVYFICAGLESQLGAADTVLTSEILDAIDEIIPPVVTLNQAGRPTEIMATGLVAQVADNRTRGICCAFHFAFAVALILTPPTT